MEKQNANLTFSNLVREITDHVRSKWDDLQLATVLSAVGKDLSDNAKAELVSADIGLKPFVITHLSDEVRYFTIEGVGDCLAPLPETKDISESDLQDAYLLNKQKRRESRTLRIRFSPDIWRAFTTPLDSRPRWVIIEDGKARVSETKNVSSDISFKIDEDDLAFDQDGRRLTFREAQQRIIEWSNANGIDVSILKGIPDRSYTAGSFGERRSVQSENLALDIGNFLLHLRQEDARRIQIPADLVIELLRKVSSHNGY